MLQLKILVDTLLKYRPIQSTLLPNEEVQPIRAGTVLTLHSFLPIEDHIRVAFSNQSFHDRNTWYVSVFHAHVIQDGQSIPLYGLQLKIARDTPLKLRTVQSAELADHERHWVPSGSLFFVHSYAIANDHLKVAFLGHTFKDRNTWFAYAYHVSLYRNGEPIPLVGLELNILRDTPLKLRPVQSTQLDENAKYLVRKGNIFRVSSYAVSQNHIRVAFANDSFRGLNTWYVYKEHAELLQDGRPIKIGSQRLTEADYQQAAQMLGTNVAVVKAVVTVETSGSGFLLDGRPKILFEAHWFSDYTNNRYDRTHPHISSAVWNPSLYIGGAGEHDRIEQAKSLDREAALMSASWGLGQIMGGNYRAAGYTNVEEFVEDMHESEGKQLIAMVSFIRSQGLDRALRALDWASFARGYNGESYAVNRYDVRLAEAYAYYSRL